MNAAGCKKNLYRYMYYYFMIFKQRRNALSFPNTRIAKMGYSSKLLGTVSASSSLRIILYVRYHDRL